LRTILPRKIDSPEAIPIAIFTRFPGLAVGLTPSAVRSYDGKLPHAGVAQW
jgi:hypothetical protein